MKVAFFTENNFNGKVSRTNLNIRTDLAWMVAFNADHYNLYSLPQDINKKYDIGIIILPKKAQIKDLNAFSLVAASVDNIRKLCNKIAIMQEGPHDYFQNASIEIQFGIYQLLDSVDFILCHNEYDVSYYKGFLNKNNVFTMPSLMIINEMPESIKIDNSIIMGGNFCSWYSGIDTYAVIKNVDVHDEFKIYAPSMGRKIDGEDRINDISYIPYMQWVDWIRFLAQMKYGIHLMRTIAAGTFALNCAYLGIPCIGYAEIDTQRILHPGLSVERIGDLVTAKEYLHRLKTDKGFYNECSEIAKTNYEAYYSEHIFLTRMNNIFPELSI